MRKTPLSRGFTLLEMLVVISIIAILLGLVVAGGAALISGRKEALTRSVLQALDRALEEFMAANQNSIPPFAPAEYASVPGFDVVADDDKLKANIDQNNIDIAGPTDDRAYSDYQNKVYPRYPDASVFIKQAQGYGEVDAILAGLGEKWLTPTPIDASASAPDDTSDLEAVQLSDVTPSVRDAWSGSGWTGGVEDAPSWPVFDTEAGLIFYVHPSNLLAQELYGRTLNKRPYFFSSGLDRLYGVTNQLPSPTGLLDADRNDSDEAIERAIRALDDNLYSYTAGPANVREPTTGGSFSKDFR